MAQTYQYRQVMSQNNGLVLLDTCVYNPTGIAN